MYDTKLYLHRVYKKCTTKLKKLNKELTKLMKEDEPVIDYPSSRLYINLIKRDIYVVINDIIRIKDLIKNIKKKLSIRHRLR